MSIAALTTGVVGLLFSVPLATAQPAREAGARARGARLALAVSFATPPAVHACAVNQDGTLKCWGNNAEGQLGIGAAGPAQSAPVTVIADGAPLTSVIGVAAGGRHTCALLVFGTVRCWGINAQGELGIGTSGVPQPAPAPVTLPRTLAIAAGQGHTCALLVNSTVRCWGHNDKGELGSGLETGAASPVRVMAGGEPLTGVVAIATGQFHTCALVSDGTVRCWGDNSFGQLGTGAASSEPQLTAVAIPSSTLNDVVSLTAGGLHTCTVKADGTMMCWGHNGNGRLGRDVTTHSPLPFPVVVTVNGVPLIDIIAAAAGGAHTCALLGNGTVRCWGNNFFGQLGDGTNTGSRSAIAVVGLSGVVALAAGNSNTCAMQSNHNVQCWGSDASGQLGNGATTDASTLPVHVTLVEASALAVLRPEGTTHVPAGLRAH